MSTNGDITLTIHKGGKKSQRTAHSPDRSSGSDEEDSSGTGVHISPSAADGPDFSDQDNLSEEDDYTLLSKEEVGPSESASRLSSQPDPPSRSLQSRRRSSRREVDHHARRNTRLTRARRQPHHSPPDSEVGSHEDLLYGDGGDPYMHAPPRPRPASYHWTPPHHGGPGHPYDPRDAPRDPRYAPQGGYPPYGPPGDQLMRVRGAYNATPQYGLQQYQQQHNSPPVQSPYYNGPHQGVHGAMGPPMGPHGTGFGPDMMHHPQFMQPNMQNLTHGIAGQGGYFPQYPSAQSPFAYQQPPQIIHAPPQIQYVLPTAASPTPQPSSAKSATPAPEASKTPPPAPAAAPAPAPAAPPPPPEPPKPDPGIEELKKMLLQERKDREEREAKQKAEEEARIKKAADDKKKAEEIAAAAKAAAAKAKDEAEKKAAEEKEKAAKKAADEAAAIKAEAEEAMKKAAEKAAEDAAKAKEEHEAALAAAQAPPPAEKQKPIRFKDAVGRKFNFPFHLCATWEGMEDLIKQAFLHVDVIGQHVAEGHYDLIGPNNEIILPAVWETVIEPDWAITMHMWPIPEPEPEPALPEVLLDPLPPGLDLGNLGGDGKGKKGKDKKKDKAKAAPPPPPANIEVIGPPPPPPHGPLAPPGAVLDAPTGPKKKPAKSTGWSLFGGAPKAKAKPKAGPKKTG